MDDVAYTVGPVKWALLALGCGLLALVGVPLVPFDTIIFGGMAVPFALAAAASEWWDRWGRAQYGGDLAMLQGVVNTQEFETMTERLNTGDDE